ncbi:peroxisomal acyl-coenzyme A oxidase 1-like, partial [Saccoglossus kowalevskii]
MARLKLLALNDSDFQHKDVAFMTRDERYSNAIRKAVLITRKSKEHGLTDMEEKHWYSVAATKQDTNGFALHTSMFHPTLSGQCDEEQKNYWLPLSENFQIIGTYAQTELGH